MAQNQRPNPDPNTRRPPRPGRAWVWSDGMNRWVKPPKPNGNVTWDDNKGWVTRSGRPAKPKPTPDPGFGSGPGRPTPTPTPLPPGAPPIEEAPPGRVVGPWPGLRGDEGTPRPPMPTDPLPDGWEWVWDEATSRWVPREKTDDEDDAENTAARQAAKAYLEDLLRQYGMEDLIGDIDSLITEWGSNWTVIASRLRQTDSYRQRFKGIANRISNGFSAITEAEYLGLEDQYRKTMSAYGLDPAFYSRDKMAELIGYDVSAAEVNDRVAAGRQMLMSADQSVLQELREYYGLGQSDLLSYLLDPSIGQQVLDRRLAKAQIGGAAERYGFQVDTWDAERWVSSAAGSAVSGFDLRTAGQMDAAMAQARRVADREGTLAAIDRERFTDLDAIDATFGDESKRLASERRAKRERARFAGSAGVSQSGLSVDRNL